MREEAGEGEENNGRLLDKREVTFFHKGGGERQGLLGDPGRAYRDFVEDKAPVSIPEGDKGTADDLGGLNIWRVGWEFEGEEAVADSISCGLLYKVGLPKYCPYRPFLGASPEEMFQIISALQASGAKVRRIPGGSEMVKERPVGDTVMENAVPDGSGPMLDIESPKPSPWEWLRRRVGCCWGLAERTVAGRE
ncbi:hypothetical protein EC973_003004 [Apophysomyces ossiformis]|uniref:Uncharacterized protein n=1 Tax=Apophysomyces ossiformis TaxID=679940 RepID=A0A8H7BXG1_9FUNG|nr:hypothetical protein EC973_003004 [Apophysomyces ossiformis]